jgi:hypothetical protein
VFHLWHGELKDRRYDARMDYLADFDPFTDIAADAGGAWRWSSNKQALHATVERYFHERDEDGEGRRAGLAMSEAAGPSR